jgi:hypothetical protein
MAVAALFRALPLALLLPVALLAPSRADPGPACAGTLLQLQVEESGTAAFDRFRFDLGLEAEASSQHAAMALLNSRLATLRTALKPLVRGELTIPAPSTYRTGGGSGAGATAVRDHASTSVAGVVEKASYDALIQVAARLPGVSLRSLQAQAVGGQEADLRSRLLRQARQAETTASALGLGRLKLLRIDQRSAGSARTLPLMSMARAAFNPDEAPAPERSVSLSLDYCLF